MKYLFFPVEAKSQLSKSKEVIHPSEARSIKKEVGGDISSFTCCPNTSIPFTIIIPPNSRAIVTTPLMLLWCIFLIICVYVPWFIFIFSWPFFYLSFFLFILVFILGVFGSRHTLQLIFSKVYLF